jgi:hypothetical protein
MAGHQNKKRPLLRALRAWNGGAALASGQKDRRPSAKKDSLLSAS